MLCLMLYLNKILDRSILCIYNYSHQIIQGNFTREKNAKEHHTRKERFC